MQRIVKDLKPIIIPDVQAHDDWIWVPGTEHVRSFMSIPLIARNRLVGVLMIDSIETNYFKQADLRKTQSLVQHVAQAIDNALLYGQVEQGRQRLSRLSQRLVEVQEQERRRIARELHDEVGQILTALTISLDSISQVTLETAIQDRVQEFQSLIQELITQINILSTELRPRVLDDFGLVPGLVALVNRISKQTGVEIDFRHSEIVRNQISPVIEINAFRLVQESLTNVIRHAGVNKASVRLWMEPDELRVQIQDEGVGFDIQTALKSEETMGLIGMTERVELTRGKLETESAPGDGTTITAAFPTEKNMLKRRRQSRDENPAGR